MTKPSRVWLELVGEAAGNEIEFAPELPKVATENTLAWEKISEVEMKAIVFVDRPLLQASAFHLIAGRKGVGKGTCVADIAARVTRGELGPKRNVVWIASEDSAVIDIKPRLVAAGGDTNRVAIVTDWPQFPRDIEKLGGTIREVGDVGMVIIDPVGNHISGKNSNAETDIRDAISPLNGLADEHEAMVFGIRHLSEKEVKAGAIAAILGSSAWVQVPRAVLVIARDNDDARISHVQCVAGNRLPPETPGRTFRIAGVKLDGLENEVTRAVWIGDSTKNIETLFGNGAAPTSKSDLARELILDTLEEADGRQMESDQLDAVIAQKTGLAAQTVKNVRVGLKNEGLVRAVPEKDELGQVQRWLIARTLADRPDRTVSGNPDTESPIKDGAFGLNTPDTAQIPTHPPKVSGYQIPTGGGTGSGRLEAAPFSAEFDWLRELEPDEDEVE